MRKTVTTILVIAFLIGMLPVSVLAETDAVPTLISMGPETWYEAAMDNAFENGLMIGWNGDMMPDDNLTKAQMATIINRAFGAADLADISDCPDVADEDWFHDDMAKAVMMGTVDPDEDGNLSPYEVVTREQVFTALADAFGFHEGDSAVLADYTDKNDISEWAESAFAALVGEGYIQGYDGKLNPKGNITRAEFAVVMDNLVKTYIDEAGDYTEGYEGNVMIRVEGVNLIGISIDGDLIIGDGVGDGEAYMKDVDILGRTLIRGGGRNSILVKGESMLRDIFIKRMNGELRIDGSNDALMGNVYVYGKCNIFLDGFFGKVTVLAPDVVVNATMARIQGGEVIGENSRIIVYDFAVVSPGPGTQLLTVPEKPTLVETSAEFFEIASDTGYITSYDTEGGFEVVVPKIVDGITVRGIDCGVFQSMEGLLSVHMQSGITYIGGGAFKYTDSLVSVTFPDTLEEIDNTAFYDCDGLTSIDLPTSLRSLGRYAFSDCDGLTTLELPEGLTDIFKYAFYDCENLQSVVFPSTFRYLDEDSNKSIFEDCSALTTFTARPGTTELGAFMFENCDSLTSVTLPEGITWLPAMLFRGCDSLVSVDIPSSVTYLERGVFRNCDSLVNFTIPSTITTVESGIFTDCDSLTDMTVPNTLTSIGSCLFSECDNLETITFEEGIENIPSNVCNNCDSLTTVNIPDSVTVISSQAFYYCTSLETIVLPDNLEEIQSWVFFGCALLDGITIPDSVTNIRAYAFGNCVSLSSIALPSGLDYLDNYVFSGCSLLASVTLNDGLLSIGRLSFGSCYALASIEIPSTVLVVADYAFAHCALNSVTFNTSSGSVYANAFHNCLNITTVTFADTGLYLYDNFMDLAIYSDSLKNAYNVSGGGTYVRVGTVWALQ